MFPLGMRKTIVSGGKPDIPENLISGEEPFPRQQFRIDLPFQNGSVDRLTSSPVASPV
jgi:hypothetical protein